MDIACPQFEKKKVVNFDSANYFPLSAFGRNGGWEEFIHRTSVSTPLQDSASLHGSCHRTHQLRVQTPASLPLPRARGQGEVCEILPVWYEL